MYFLRRSHPLGKRPSARCRGACRASSGLFPQALWGAFCARHEDKVYRTISEPRYTPARSVDRVTRRNATEPADDFPGGRTHDDKSTLIHILMLKSWCHHYFSYSNIIVPLGPTEDSFENLLPKCTNWFPSRSDGCIWIWSDLRYNSS